ncbi:MAG: response regulator transcription factor [Firmicutes bacterium]|nr:response regulator transcription factor [Bacillota bacterium]
MNKKTVRVLLAEKHTLFRQCLAGMLGNEGIQVVGETDRAAEVPELYRSGKPDLVITDIQLSDGNALDLLADFFTKHPKLPVLIISSYYEPEMVEKALSLGVKGYYTKQSLLDEISEAILKVVDGERAFHNDVLDTLLLSFQKKRRRTLKDDEIKILKLCSEGKSYTEISSELFIGERTFYRKLNNIFDKLGVINKAQALTVAIRKGLI